MVEGIDTMKNSVVVPHSWVVRSGLNGGVKLTFHKTAIGRKQSVDTALTNSSERAKSFTSEHGISMIGDEVQIVSYYIGEKDKLIYAVGVDGVHYRLLSQNMHGVRQNDKTSLVRLLERARPV